MTTSFSDYLKLAEYNFLLEVATVVNKAQKSLTCKVERGISMSFLNFDGACKLDLGVNGWISLISMDSYNTKVVMEYNSVYLGRCKYERTLKVGNLTVEFLAGLLLDLRDGKVRAGDQIEACY